jgi:hypothetical protein
MSKGGSRWSFSPRNSLIFPSSVKPENVVHVRETDILEAALTSALRMRFSWFH